MVSSRWAPTWGSMYLARTTEARATRQHKIFGCPDIVSFYCLWHKKIYLKMKRLSTDFIMIFVTCDMKQIRLDRYPSETKGGRGSH